MEKKKIKIKEKPAEKTVEPKEEKNIKNKDIHLSSVSKTSLTSESKVRLPSEEKKEEPLEEKKWEPNKNQTVWIIGIMVGLIVFILVFYFAIQSMKTFSYNGLTFTKEKFGEIDVYHYYYYFSDASGQVYKYNLFLRNDPRKNNVPVTGEPIKFDKEKTVYISINDSGLRNCSYSSIAVAGLSQFLTNNMVKVKGALLDKREALLDNRTYASCEDNMNGTVIVIESGSETGINIKGDCYKITSSNCGILDATEKFEVQAILDAKAAASSSS